MVGTCIIGRTVSRSVLHSSSRQELYATTALQLFSGLAICGVVPRSRRFGSSPVRLRDNTECSVMVLFNSPPQQTGTVMKIVITTSGSFPHRFIISQAPIKNNDKERNTVRDRAHHQTWPWQNRRRSEKSEKLTW